MNELMHKAAKQREEQSRRWRELEVRAKNMSPADSVSMVAQLKQQPDDQELFTTVLRYYQSRSDLKRLNRLTLWYIQNHANGKVEPWIIHPGWDKSAYEHGAALWKENLKKRDANADTWRRAARYLEGGSKEESEKLLLEAKQKFPGEQWSAALAQVYALTLMGVVGPRADFNTVREVSAAEANSAFARNVASRLQKSDDVNVLLQTTQWLLAWSQLPQITPPARQAALLLQRAAQLAPKDSRVDAMRAAVDSMRKRIVKGNVSFNRQDEKTQMEALTKGILYGVHRGGLADNEIAPRLRELVSRHSDDMHYADTIFQANNALVIDDLRRGDRKAAAKRLLASTGGPVGPRMRIAPVDMTAARELVDWGERTTVAEFLERCARFNRRGKQLDEWASEIRRGINPDLIPYTSLRSSRSTGSAR